MRGLSKVTAETPTPLALMILGLHRLYAYQNADSVQHFTESSFCVVICLLHFCPSNENRFVHTIDLYAQL